MTLEYQKDHLLERKDKPVEFFSFLLDLWREERNENSEILKNIIIDVHNSKEIDFCKLGSEAINDGFRVFDVVIRILEKVLPDLNLDIEILLKLFENLYIGTQNDCMAQLQYKPINELVEIKPVFSRNLLNRLINIDRPFVTGYISNLFLIFSRNNEHVIHNELDGLKFHKSIYVINGIVNTLGNLDYKPKKNRGLLQKTFDIFGTLEERQLENIDACVSHAYGRLLGDSKLASKKLLHCMRKNKPAIDHAILDILFRNTEKYGNEDWFGNFLMELARTLSSHKGIIDMNRPGFAGDSIS